MNHRVWLVGAAVLVGAMPMYAAERGKGTAALWVYLGTYTGPKSKGIYRCRFDAKTGQLSPAELAGEVTSPSFVAIHPSGRFLYSVNEVSVAGGKPGGGVTAFAIDSSTGQLTKLNQQSSGGAGPCHLVVDRAGKHVLVSNYGGGSVTVLPIADDGKLGEATAFVQHKGSSANPKRQEGPHAHSINLDKANRFAFTADLGLDKVLVYRFDAARGTLMPNEPPSAPVAPGSGPRHFAFHPSGQHAYVINEMANTVTMFSYDAEHGVLTPKQTLPTLPADFTGTSYTAEVQVHPSGRFVYGSNRGHNSITVFAVEPSSGELRLVSHQASGIKTPRNFGIDPTGHYLLVANQDGNSVLVFRINQQTGSLEATDQQVEVAAPVCVKFLSRQ